MEDDDLLPISGLEHLLYCERQCALIHVERLWRENVYTTEGRQLHERVDDGGHETRPGVEVVRSLPLISRRLGLRGIADVVELRGQGSARTIFPVEYKRGSRHRWINNEIQLCAQGISLEEMFDIDILKGAVYFGESKRRIEVVFDKTLRDATERAAKRYHEIINQQLNPPSRRDTRCSHCSLEPICLPDVTNGASVLAYLHEAVQS